LLLRRALKPQGWQPGSKVRIAVAARVAADEGSVVLQASKAVLLIIDVQKAIDAAYHAADGARNNPDAEANIARLLAVWRRKHWPIIHVRHDSTFPHSAYRPGQIGNQFKDEVAPEPDEMIVPKRTNNAFIATDLERYLRTSGLQTLVVAGVSTNNSVEATVRMAGNLGFQTYLVADACCTCARRDFSGRLRSADEVHSMSLANLHGEYCTVVETAAVLI
jgi:nicotinamidase-related amidase